MSQTTKPQLKTVTKPRKASSPHNSSHKTFLEHLEELRLRLTWSVLTLIVGGIVGYSIRDKIFYWLVKPLDQPLYYNTPTGGLDYLIKICIFFGALCAIPVLVYQFLKFLEPALPERARSGMAKILLASISLALVGVSFAYFISLPTALHFLANLNEGNITSLISASEYLSFVMVYLAGFAALFQLPLIMLFLNRIKPLNPKKLFKAQGYIILFSFVVAAILTPTPDPFNQTIMAVPIIILYEVSVGLIWLKNRMRA